MNSATSVTIGRSSCAVYTSLLCFTSFLHCRFERQSNRFCRPTADLYLYRKQLVDPDALMYSAYMGVFRRVGHQRR